MELSDAQAAAGLVAPAEEGGAPAEEAGAGRSDLCENQPLT